MLAAVALLGLGAVGLSKTQGDSTQARQEMATQDQLSDDPLLFPFGQVPPRIYRQTGTSNVHWEFPREHVIYRELKGRQGEKLDNVLRDPTALTEAQIEGMRSKRWDAIHPDIPFTGNNGSTRNPRTNWARTLPRDPAPDTVWGSGVSRSLSETCGDEQVNSFGGPAYQEAHYIHQHGFFAGGTPRVMVDHHAPAFCHLYGPNV